MHRDELIITVFTLIDDLLPIVTGGQRLRQRGPQPTLADSEVLTIEAVGSFLGFTQDRAVALFSRPLESLLSRLEPDSPHDLRPSGSPAVSLQSAALASGGGADTPRSRAGPGG